MIPKWVAEFIIMLAIGIIEKMKPTPEEVERMSHNEKVRKLATYINAGYPGFELPVGTTRDVWGESITKVDTPTRVESRETNATEPGDGKSQVHDS